MLDPIVAGIKRCNCNNNNNDNNNKIISYFLTVLFGHFEMVARSMPSRSTKEKVWRHWWKARERMTLSKDLESLFKIRTTQQKQMTSHIDTTKKNAIFFFKMA